MAKRLFPVRIRWIAVTFLTAVFIMSFCSASQALEKGNDNLGDSFSNMVFLQYSSFPEHIGFTGENITIDDSGFLTAAENSVLGTGFTVIAVTDDGEEIRRGGKIGGGVFDNDNFSRTERLSGFIFRLPESAENSPVMWHTFDGRPDAFASVDGIFIDDTDSSGVFDSISVVFSLSTNHFLAEDPETTVKWLDETCDMISGRQYDGFIYRPDIPLAEEKGVSIENWKQTDIFLSGHPVRLYTYEYVYGSNGLTETVHCGGIIFGRFNLSLNVDVAISGSHHTVTLDDLRVLASFFEYDDSKDVPIHVADVEPLIQSEKSSDVVSAGNSLQFTVNYANAAAVEKYIANTDPNVKSSLLGGITEFGWTIEDAETKKAPEYAKISSNGKLTTDRSISEPHVILVRAKSNYFGIPQSIPAAITIVPAARKVDVDPASITFYAGTDDEAVIRASVDPASAAQTGLIWTLSDKKTVELTDNGDGTATVKPVKAGKAVVSVKEATGKTAKVSVVVKQPVERITLSAKGRAVPGKTVSVTAGVEPKNASDKSVQWKLNVDESIATVTSRGQIRISSSAPEGTIITVTCTAAGAPVPVTESMDIQVLGR